MNKILDKIKKHQKKEYILFGSIPLFLKDKLTNEIDIYELIVSIHNTLPKPPADLIKSIIVLDSPIFAKKQVNAFYHNDSLYLTNEQDNLMDMLDDIVHEYAHALEKKYAKEIYGDRNIMDEFLSKRDQLEKILRYEGFETQKYDFDNISYNKKLDNFLLNVVGYEKFNNLTKYGLFINPYAATSLREYFATGFEEYALGDDQELVTISPKLFNKIRSLF
jgi:hypothetical protein